MKGTKGLKNGANADWADPLFAHHQPRLRKPLHADALGLTPTPKKDTPKKRLANAPDFGDK
jgi:hypothetical protein